MIISLPWAVDRDVDELDLDLPPVEASVVVMVTCEAEEVISVVVVDVLITPDDTPMTEGLLRLLIIESHGYLELK